MQPHRLAQLKHDLANPLSSVLAESQMLLLQADELPEDMIRSLRAIEAAALRMRTLLRELTGE